VKLMSETYRPPVSQLRDVAHAISDRIYEQLTGIPGFGLGFGFGFGAGFCSGFGLLTGAVFCFDVSTMVAFTWGGITGALCSDGSVLQLNTSSPNTSR